MSKLKFFVRPSGAVEALHADQTQQALERLGATLKIQRVSRVEPEPPESGRGWGWGVAFEAVTLPNPEPFATRGEALAWEQETVERLLAGELPERSSR